MHTLILGAGPAGLACAERLAAAGLRPLVVEGAAVAGGLMRGVRRGGFRVDLGRKELYTRLSGVFAYLRELLGDQLRPYPHRVGLLYDGRIVEATSVPRGPRRGMPWSWLVLGGLQLAWSRLRPHARPPQTYEEHWYRRRGARFARILSQGFDEKFRGRAWAELPPPQAEPAPEFADDAPHGWWHPRLGTEQIVDALLARIAAGGGEVALDERICAIECHGGRIGAVITERAGERRRHEPQFVASCLPVERLGDLIGIGRSGPTSTDLPPRRGVVLVYLFCDGSPRFPHAWLHVNCPKLRMGRVVNYSGFGGEMAPAGTTCLCVEFFYVGDNPFAALGDDGVAALALRECAAAGLVDPAGCHDRLVLDLPGGDPATTAKDWHDPGRRDLVAALARMSDLFDMKRPGIDKALQAGIDTAAAIVARSPA